MEAAQILGTLAAIISFAIIVVGLPMQIYKNWKRKNTDGISNYIIYPTAFSYTIWWLYGWFKPDWYIVFAYALGVVFSWGLVIQTIYYYFKNKKKRWRVLWRFSIIRIIKKDATHLVGPAYRKIGKIDAFFLHFLVF